MHSACFLLLFAFAAHAFNSTTSKSTPFQRYVRSSDHSTQTVKCHYFKAPPVGTYCLVSRGQNSTTTGEDAQKGCEELGMTLLSSRTTPLDRLCSVIGFLALQYHHIWWADEFNVTHLLKFNPCRTRPNEKVFQGNTTVPNSNATFSNTAVICEGKQLKLQYCVALERRTSLSIVQVEKNPFMATEVCTIEKDLTFEESLQACKNIGMTMADYDWLIRDSSPFGVAEDYEFPSFWIAPTAQSNFSCAIFNTRGDLQEDADCSDKSEARCIYDNVIRCGGECDPIESFESNGTTGVPEVVNATEGTSHKCYESYNWPNAHISKALIGAWSNVNASHSAEGLFDELKLVESAVNTTDDVRTMPYMLAQVLINYNRLVIRLSDAEKDALTETLADIIFEIAEKTTLKTKILKNMSEDDRLEAISCLLTFLEDFKVEKNI